VISPNNFKPGMVIKLAGNLYSVVNYQHVKPGKGPAYFRTKLKDIRSEALIDKTFRAQDKLDKAYLQEKKLTFLYQSQGVYYFMDQESFEEIPIDKKRISEITDCLLENSQVEATLSDGEIIEIKLPIFIELTVKSTEPAVKGNTAKNTPTKKAVLETGAEIEVPLFVKPGDKIKIDTRVKEYVGKAR
jgi:elongation factor P